MCQIGFTSSASEILDFEPGAIAMDFHGRIAWVVFVFMSRDCGQLHCILSQVIEGTSWTHEKTWYPKKEGEAMEVNCALCLMTDENHDLWGYWAESAACPLINLKQMSVMRSFRTPVPTVLMTKGLALFKLVSVRMFLPLRFQYMPQLCLLCLQSKNTHLVNVSSSHWILRWLLRSNACILVQMSCSHSNTHWSLIRPSDLVICCHSYNVSQKVQRAMLSHGGSVVWTTRNQEPQKWTNT